MQKAIVADQAIINDSETLDVTYTDSTDEKVEEKAELTPEQIKKQTIIELIKTAATEAEVNKQMKHLPNDKDVQMAALERKTELEKNA
jgi:hypothetical protein